MGAALSIFVLLSISVFIIRVAAVALRYTGLAETTARFQALSAFTGTGFTTSEAETVVNYPIRRRIVSLLIIIGNMGLVTVFAALVASLVHTDGEVAAVVTQLIWLAAGLALLWFLMLNKTADRILCAWIGKLIDSTTILGRRSFHRLLQIGDGYSVCEHHYPAHWLNDLTRTARSRLDRLKLQVLAIQSPGGELLDSLEDLNGLTTEHTLILFGPDSAHDVIGGAVDTANSDLESKAQ
ncbi:MAG: hypothetical protein ACR2Q3_15395 [Woeseiaceae bacterium]